VYLIHTKGRNFIEVKIPGDSPRPEDVDRESVKRLTFIGRKPFPKAEGGRLIKGWGFSPSYLETMVNTVRNALGWAVNTPKR